MQTIPRIRTIFKKRVDENCRSTKLSGQDDRPPVIQKEANTKRGT